jgi:hypothetical protein
VELSLAAVRRAAALHPENARAYLAKSLGDRYGTKVIASTATAALQEAGSCWTGERRFAAAASAPLGPGWYPSPNYVRVERYWDGVRWTGAQKWGNPTPVQRPAHVSDKPLSGWLGVPSGVRAFTVLGALFFVILFAAILIHNEPWKSQREKDCEAAMAAEGYQDQDFENAVQFCVGVQ